MTILILIFVLLLPTASWAGAIATAAAGLSPGQWTTLTQTQMPGLNATSHPAWDDVGSSSGPGFDGSQPAWDSTAQKWYIETAEHGNATGCPEAFPAFPNKCWKPLWTYTESTSTWVINGPYPVTTLGGTTPVEGTHTYGHVAWDNVNRVMYVKQYNWGAGGNSIAIFRYCVTAAPSYCAAQGANTWAPIPLLFLSSGEVVGQQIGWHPGLNGGSLVHFNQAGNTTACGAVFAFKEGTTGTNGVWTTLDNGASCKFANAGHSLINGQISTSKNVLLIGPTGTGANTDLIWWKVSNTGTVTQLTNAPCAFHSTDFGYSQAAEDPNTGNIYFIGCSNAGQMWKLDPTGSGTWTQIAATLNAPGQICQFALVGAGKFCGTQFYATPISTYGVIAYWYFQHTGNTQVFIYKPSASGGDIVAPTVSLTAPSAGTVSGNVSVSATASDNVGVAGVQFKLDGANLGAEDTAAPFSISWNSSLATNGNHTLTATARDAAGNNTTSSSISVTVTGGTSTSTSSVLSTAADAMGADTWATLTTPASCNTTSTLLESGSNILKDASQGAYDPVLQQVHFIAVNSVAPVRHVVYDLASNTCTVRATPPWSTGGISNSNEYGPTIDARGRILERGRAGTTTSERSTLDTQTWLTAVAPNGAVASNTVGLQANAFHYERGSAGQLILAGLETAGNGVLYRYDPALNTFARLNGGALLSGFVDYSVAEYSEVHKVTIFGGRGGTYRQMNTRGTISTISTSGMACQPGINRDGILHADPVTGNFVLLCGGGTSSWQIYDPVANAWTVKTTPGSVSNHILQVTSPTGFGQTYGKVGVPISNHGVILYIGCDNGTACQMRLYKGGTFTTADRDFKTNCYKANVIHCNGMDSSNDVTGDIDQYAFDLKLQGTATGVSGAYSTPRLDCTIKLGNCSLQLDVGANSGANSGGHYANSFGDDGSRSIGKDQEVYIQWRQRWTPCLLYTGANDAECTANGLANNWLNTRVYAINGGGGLGDGGWKLFGLTEGARANHTQVPSHSDIGFVVQNTGQFGMIQWYSYDAGAGSIIEPKQIAGLDYKQYAPGEVDCPYVSPANYPEPGCKRFRPDQWMTVQVHYKANGVWNTNGAGTFEMWLAQEGLPSVRVARYDPAIGTGINYGNANTAESKFGQYLLTVYHTEKDPTQTNPVAYTWFDNVIISTTRIADPGTVTVPDTTNPTTTITSPIPPTTNTAASPITVSGTATDNVSVTSVTWTCIQCVTKGGTATSSPGASISWLIPALDLVAGSNTLNVVAHDAAGNVSTTATLTITYAPSSTYWVSKLGNDSNGCTSSNAPLTTTAKLTIAAGLTCLASGNTLFIRAGTYNERLTNATSNIPSGSSFAAPTTIAGYPGEVVTLLPTTQNSTQVINLARADQLAGQTNQYILWQDLILDGTNVIGGGVLRVGQSHNHFNRVEVRNNGAGGSNISTEAGVTVGGNDGLGGNDGPVTDFVFSHGSVHDNALIVGTENGNNAPYAFYDSRTTGSIIEYTQIYRNGGYGIHGYSSAGDHQSAIYRYNTIYDNSRKATNQEASQLLASSGNNHQVYGNVVYQTTSTDIGTNFTHGITIQSSTGSVVYNNTVYNSPRAGIQIAAGGIGTIVRNNIVMNSDGSSSGVWRNVHDDGVSTTKDHNDCFGRGGTTGCDITTDPLLVNPTGTPPNFQIGATSLANNTGVNLGSTYSPDIAGVARPGSGAWDLGAYEFIATFQPVVTIVNPTANTTLGVTQPLFSLGGTSNLP